MCINQESLHYRPCIIGVVVLIVNCIRLIDVFVGRTNQPKQSGWRVCYSAHPRRGAPVPSSQDLFRAHTTIDLKNGSAG